MLPGVKTGPHYHPRTSGGREATTNQNFPCSSPQAPYHLRLQDHVPFAKGSVQPQGLSPMRFRELEPEKRHGVYFGAGPPHSPKLKVRGPSPPIPIPQPELQCPPQTIRAESPGSSSKAPDLALSGVPLRDIPLSHDASKCAHYRQMSKCCLRPLVS